MNAVALALFLALCLDCGCGRWLPDARAVDVWEHCHTCCGVTV